MFIISWLCLNSLSATKRKDNEFDHEMSNMLLKKQKISNIEITENKSLTDLCFDIKYKICLYLPVPDFIHLQATSQSWYCALNDKNLWTSIHNQMNIINFQEEKEIFSLLKDVKIAVRNRYLHILVNILDNPERIYYLVHHYKLHRFWDSLFGSMLNHISHFSNLTFFEKKELYAQGDIMAQGNHIEYYQERNTEASQTIWAINDWMIDQGDEKAIERKIKGVYHGYDQGNAEKLIDYFVEKGSHAAILAKIYHYMIDNNLHEESHRLIELLIDQGNDQAKFCKAHALAHGLYGYKKDVHTALKISDEISLRTGDLKAMKIRLEETYNYGVSKKNHYVVSSDVKKDFIEQLVAKRFSKSFYYKVHGLNEGLYGYNKNQNLAKEFIEELVFERNMEGFKYKLEGIEKGIFGYPKPLYNQEISTVEKFIEKMAQKGYLIAMKYKLENVWQQGKEKIEQLEQENNCVGYYLKSLGIKYGLFGFEKNREYAVQYILTYSIPY